MYQAQRTGMMILMLSIGIAIGLWLGGSSGAGTYLLVMLAWMFVPPLLALLLHGIARLRAWRRARHDFPWARIRR